MNPELESLRDENQRLRELCRTHEVDRDTKEFYERLLSEIGMSIGCNHLDEQLPRCVSDISESRDYAIGLLTTIYRRHDGSPTSIQAVEKYLKTLGKNVRQG